MKGSTFIPVKLAVGLSLIWLAAGGQGQAGTEQKAAAKPLPRRALPIVPEVEIPRSVFAAPSSPHEGRNPFFPESLGNAPGPKNPVIENLGELNGLVLNGITSPPRPTAMINGRTFEPGEEGQVKLPTGAKVRIRCETIRGTSVIIQVAGGRRELRLRAGI